MMIDYLIKTDHGQQILFQRKRTYEGITFKNCIFENCQEVAAYKAVIQ